MLLKKIYKLAIWMGLIKKLVVKEFSSPVKVNLKHKFKVWRNGFLSQSYLIYGFDKNHYSNYLSDYSRMVHTPKINGKYGQILNNKIIFAKTLTKYLEFLPKYFFQIKDGVVVAFDDTFRSGKGAILSLLKDHNCIVLKPTMGGGAKNVYFLREQDGVIKLNHKSLTTDEFSRFVGRLDDYIGIEFIEQADILNSINSKTTNTVRLLTLWGCDNRYPHIAAAVQRIGTAKSEPVDSWVRGGLCCSIDLDKGVLGPGVTFPCHGKLEWYDSHPETNVQILNQSIPNWEIIKDTILQIASELPFLPYIGWDIVVTDESFKIIEGNDHSDVHFLQVHAPLLADKKVKNFYLKYNVIKG
jgi:hypothetical protein